METITTRQLAALAEIWTAATRNAPALIQWPNGRQERVRVLAVQESSALEPFTTASVLIERFDGQRWLYPVMEVLEWSEAFRENIVTEPGEDPLTYLVIDPGPVSLSKVC